MTNTAPPRIISTVSIRTPPKPFTGPASSLSDLECLQIVREMNIPVVKGNHDEYCSTENHLDGFNPHAAEAVHWTREQLSADDKQWLRDLKYSRMAANFTMVHATLDAPERWGYVFDKLAAAASFPYQNTQM